MQIGCIFKFDFFFYRLIIARRQTKCSLAKDFMMKKRMSFAQPYLSK